MGNRSKHVPDNHDAFGNRETRRVHGIVKKVVKILYYFRVSDINYIALFVVIFSIPHFKSLRDDVLVKLIDLIDEVINAYKCEKEVLLVLKLVLFLRSHMPIENSL